jgi:hypothetical protein
MVHDLFCRLLIKLSDAFAPSTWSNWALVIVGIGAIISALRTLTAIRKQTKHIGRQALSMRRQTTILRASVAAAEKNAESAKITAHALINSERAWVDGEIVNNAALRITNYGRTPAYIIKYEIRNGGLIKDAPYSPDELASKYMKQLQAFLKSGESLGLEVFEAHKVFDDLIHLKDTTPVVYVIIHYADIVAGGPESHILRYTSFLYHFNPTRGLERIAAENRHT